MTRSRAEQARKDDEQRKQAEKLDLERQKREAKEKEEEQQRQKDLTDAALRLKAGSGRVSGGSRKEQQRWHQMTVAAKATWGG